MNRTGSVKRTVARRENAFADAVARVYEQSATGELENHTLYRELANAGVVEGAELARVEPVGKAKTAHSVARRRVRWAQQTLKHLGVLERTGAGRGRWQLTARSREELTPPPARAVLIAFATDLGIAVWGRAQDTFSRLGEVIDLCVVSPPYPLRKPRRYGNPTVDEYIDFVSKVLEPIVRNLRDGGSIALNVSNDIFEPGSPARSTYVEELVLTLCKRFALSKMDQLPWVNKCKPPGPTQWSSIQRMQLRTGYEHVYWLTSNPKAVRADNRRVLLPHSDRQAKLIQQGGERRVAVFSDGSYRLRRGSFGAETAGRIPTNVLEFGHTCVDLRRTREAAVAAGLPLHGATMPLALADFLVRWLCPPDGLVVDPCAGWLTTGKAAEINGRRWICSEQFAEYLAGAANRFGGEVLRTI
ncbi:site-specific DNA-methyltransferase [Biomphalaria pfeifferi]|uniref:Site-specific DNA-methyltransferase n=1 Tax=Biomphalaria pfeifferi TaxID=112525 RepID=A0AAD8ETM1_BIOPF|nr:site-specific DNA-methyltransferase [Biomphalaria pfeifferi]